MQKEWYTFKEKQPNPGEVIQVRYDDHPGGWLSKPSLYDPSGPYGRSEDMQWCYTDQEAAPPGLTEKRRLLQERIGQLIVEFHQENPELTVAGISFDTMAGKVAGRQVFFVEAMVVVK